MLPEMGFSVLLEFVRTKLDNLCRASSLHLSDRRRRLPLLLLPLFYHRRRRAPSLVFKQARQRTADSGQRTADSGQRTADSGQPTPDGGQRRAYSTDYTADSRK